MIYAYEIEILRDGEWITEMRYYKHKKDLNDFDLHDIQDKRRNAKFIKMIKPK